MILRKSLIIILIILAISSVLFYYKNNFFTDEIDFTKAEKNKLIFFEFENNLRNNFFTICKSSCNGFIQKGVIEYTNLNDGYAVMLNDKNRGLIEIPFEGITVQNENGTSISFWVSVHTHDKRHNMIYNKGPVGWGSSFLKSINGLYEGDLKEFQALWTGNNSKQYLNIHCDDGHEIILDKWYFVVHVLENDQSTLRQYINGKEYCNTKSETPINFETTDNLILGKVIGTYDDTSNLTMDDFTIHNYALNEKEIERNFIIGLNNHK